MLTAPVLTPCRHCRRLAVRHARGLCQPCYRDPCVRKLFPALRPTRRPPQFVGAADDLEIARLPTHYPPGSEGKIAVLAARCAAGLPLFHPADAAPA
jgi:hypothetical protein